MAFTVYSTDDGRDPAIEYMAAGAITPKLGMLLYPISGKLAVAGGSHAPRYVSMIDCASALTSGTLIPVIRIENDMIFEGEADGTATMSLGVKYDVTSDGMKVDADGTSNGAFELVGKGSVSVAAGTKIRGRFNV